MMRGFLLFLKHNRVIPCFAIAAAGTLACKFLLITTAPDVVTEVAFLWCAALTTIPLLFIMTNEDDLDRTAPRSLAKRRTILWAMGSAAALALSWLCFPNGGEWGFETMIRDCLALAGLGMASATFLSISAIWLLPLLATFVSSLFSWPLHPRILHGTVGFLRAPSGLTFSPGIPNLAWPVAIIIGVSGALWGIVCTPHRPAHMRRIRSQTVHNGRDLSKGLHRVRLQHLCLLACATVEGISLFSALPWWGGSVRLLFEENIGLPPFIHMVCAAAVGVIVTQSRWRTGVVVWERISPRSQASLFWRACWVATSTCLLGIGAAVGAATITAIIGMAHDGLPARLILLELARGIRAFLPLLASLIVTSVVGSALGWLWHGPWVTPGAVILAFAVSLILPHTMQDVGAAHGIEYGYDSCRDGSHVRVCSTSPNSGYLVAATTSLDAIYRSSPHRDVLPRTVILTDNQFLGDNDAPETPTIVPTIGAAGSRGVFALSSLSSSGVTDSLRYSIHGWCHGAQLSDIDQILGIEPESSSDTMEVTLRALARCRT